MCVCQFVNININIYIYTGYLWKPAHSSAAPTSHAGRRRRRFEPLCLNIKWKRSAGPATLDGWCTCFFLWCLAWYLLGIFHKNVLKAACSIFSYGHIRRGTPRFQTHMYDLELLSLNCWCSWWNSDEFLLLRLKTFQRGGTVWKSSISIPFGYLT